MNSYSYSYSIVCGDCRHRWRLLSIVQFLVIVFHCTVAHCHSWNSLPCSHQQFSIIATFYRPPATTISFYSTTSSPEKKKPSSNRLGTPLSRGVEKPEGPSALQPTTESPIVLFYK